MNQFSNHFKLNFHDDLVKILYDKSSSYIPEQITKVLAENNVLSNLPFNRQSVILYNGVRYKNYKEIDKVNSWNKPISFHKSLNKKMDRLVKYKIDLENERSIISAFIRRILNMCKTTEDIYFLMPRLLQDIFPSYITDSRLASNQLTIRGIHKEKFQEKNEYYLNILRDRVLTDLLIN